MIEREERLGPTWTADAMTQTILDVYATETQAIIDRYSTATQLVLDRQATETAIWDATEYAATYNAQTATATLWTKTPTPTSSYTPLPTNTPRPSHTPAPRRVQITDFPSSSIGTFYALSEGVRGRSCPNRDCAVELTLAYGEGIQVMGSADGEAVSGETRWWVAQVNGQSVFIHSSLLSRNRPAASSSSNGGGSTGNTQRPANCTEARAMGLSAEQAAQWSHLDRDGDGVACYGD